MIEHSKLEIEKAIRAINETLLPHKIYLFGSFAQDDPNNESDLDLCIITKTLNIRKVEALRNVRRSLAKEVSMPLDLLIYTSDEFSERSNLVSTLEYKILNEGVLVYGS